MVEVTIKFKTSNENGNKIKSFFKNDVMKNGPFGFLRDSDDKYLDIDKTKDYKVKVSDPIKEKDKIKSEVLWRPEKKPKLTKKKEKK